MRKGTRKIDAGINKRGCSWLSPLITSVMLLAHILLVLGVTESVNAEVPTTTEEQKLASFRPIADAWFGYSVANYGDTVIIGARNDSYVVQDQNVEYVHYRAGTAYVFKYNQTTSEWEQQQQLTAHHDGDSYDVFGESVAIYGNTALIGARGFEWDEFGDSYNSGATYVFSYDPATRLWSAPQKLTASDEVEFAEFGTSVAIHGNTAIIGAPGNPNNFHDHGSAYVFRYNSSTGGWEEIQKLIPSDGLEKRDQFGRSIAIYGDTAIIGAYFDDDLGDISGSAYVFRYNPSTGQWEELQKLIASDGGVRQLFGYSVAIYEDTAIIGTAPDGHANNVGSAYVFRYNPSAGQWEEVQKLMASDRDTYDKFGFRVALHAHTAIIGTDPIGGLGSNSGFSYVFRYNPSTEQWEEVQKLTASDGAANKGFGYSIAFYGATAIIGAIYDDGPVRDTGSAYVFSIPAAIQPPTAAFSALSTSGPAPLTVDFTDESTGEIDSWEWNFGDGGTSTERNPSYIYYAEGSYDVSLTVSNLGGQNRVTKAAYIVVTPGDAPDLTVRVWEFHVRDFGRRIRVRLQLSNIGNLGAGRFGIAMYHSDDGISLGELLAERIVRRGLGINEIRSKGLRYESSNSLAGQYIICVIDPDNLVDEGDENNNRIVILIP